MTQNLSAQITEYISKENRLVKAGEIYEKFEKKDFSDNMIAGALKRLKDKGRLVSPKRGYYENTNSKNVLNELKKDINILVDKYNRSIPITIFTSLADSDKEEYTNIIDALSKMM